LDVSTIVAIVFLVFEAAQKRTKTIEQNSLVTVDGCPVKHPKLD
jgi:hypothetical protein